MAILKRPMFRKGGSTNEGIMHGLERRGYADSNWKDIAAAYGHGKGTSTDVRNPLNYLDPDYREQMIESHTPTKIDWSWLKPRIRKHTLPSGDEIMLRGGIPIKQQETVPPEAIRGYDIPIPEGMPKEKIDTGNGTGNQLEKIIAKKESLSDRNKRYMDMMAPHMQKRMINDALAAASEAFGKSTGNTKQDIANAISAAAKGMRGTTDLADKVAMMTLTGEIQKDIEKSKEKQLGNYQFLAKLSKEDPTTFNKIMKQEDKNKYEELLEQTGSTDSASRLWAKRKYPDVKDTFSAAEAPKIEIEDLADGVYYIGMGKDGDRFFKVEGGKIDDKFSRSGVL